MLDDQLVATDEDIRDCIEAAAIMTAIHDGTFIDLADRRAWSRVPQYHYWVARQLARLQRPWEAIAWYARALEKGRIWHFNRPDFAISMANVLSDVGNHEAAIGFYKHLRDVKPPVKTAFQSEANLYRRLGRLDDLRALAKDYRRRFGDEDGFAGTIERGLG